MKDFVTIEFQSTCSQDEVMTALKAYLSGFQWRGGDSDMQGLYISGKNTDSVNIQVWLSESPKTATISFRSSWLDVADREVLKQQLLNIVTLDTISSLGVLLSQRDD